MIKTYITPQGDGNHVNHSLISYILLIKTYITPQGDGNKKILDDIKYYTRIKTYITPQGDGNHDATWMWTKPLNDKNLYNSARRRKQEPPLLLY